MAKGKTATVFFCQNCGYESTKWLGQCPGCREWNTFVEETIDKTELKNTGNGAKRDRREASEPCVLSEIAIREENKTLTGIKELDRVLGGGIVQGSLTLVGGDPGIGKSTLLLQVCHNLSTAGHKVLYISGEESKVQIKMRADRLGAFSEHMLLLCETNLDIISEVIRKSKPEVVIIDSIQTMYNENVSAAPGSVSQVRESTAGHKVLYISGEESKVQIKMRADRLGAFSEHMLLLCETNLDIISEVIRKSKPEVVIIDSIQTMYNENVSAAPGSVSQVRESTGILLQLAKGLGISIFIVGHVTKEGTVAGPRVLEHMVDTVLYFEGDRHASYRILRGVKNRFGSTNEIGVFEMRETGLAEVKNPSEYMLNGRPENASGSVVACTMEGTRPLLIELQALVCHSNFGIPRRQTTGTDFNRVNLLMAVLEKRSGVQLSSCDAYVNITGGIKIQEPAIDLGIVLAILSSFRNKALNPKMVAFGEVGLSGEVRAVSMAKQRVAEAEKLGFEECVVPYVSLEECKKGSKIRVIGVSSVQDAMDRLF